MDSVPCHPFLFGVLRWSHSNYGKRLTLVKCEPFVWSGSVSLGVVVWKGELVGVILLAARCGLREALPAAAGRCTYHASPLPQRGDANAE